MLDDKQMMALLQQRWLEIFQQLANEGEVAPGQVLRCEGMMEAWVLAGCLSAAAMQQAMSVQYQQVHGRTLADVWGEQWYEFFRFPQIPAFAPRAPVVPSTSDVG